MRSDFADFIRPAYRDYRWLETHWFSATTQHERIRAHFWIGFRTNLDVAATKVYAYSGTAADVLEMDFLDTQYHLPVGAARLSDFSLASGLAVRGRPAPDRYELRYRSRCGRMRADLQFEAIMAPADLAFSAIDGGGAGFAAFHRGDDGTDSVGHIDQTMQVTGEIELDGMTHPVSCLSNRDHSWSPRAEYRNSRGSFDELHFGRELTILAHTAEDDDGRPTVTNAYALRRGELRRIAKASVVYERDGFRTTALRYDLVDDHDERYLVTAQTRSSAALDSGQNQYLVVGLIDCSWGGRPGWGEFMWHADIPHLQLRRLADGRPKLTETRSS
jgi:hypothetical protein